MGGDSGPRSLCVVLRHALPSPYFFSIVQLDPLTPEMIKNPQKKIYAESLAHLRLAPEVPPLKWLFSPPPSSTDDLYILPDWTLGSSKYDPLHGATFNCSTKTFQPINCPNNCKLGGFAVTVKHDIYFMGYPSWYDQPPLDIPDAVVFERYIPATHSWEKEEPFPYGDTLRLGFQCKINATAVWDDTILLNIGDCEIWAYHVSYHEWYHVNAQDDKTKGYNYYNNNKNRCYDIIGEAVVVKNTIYALSKQHLDLVLALSIEKNGNGCDLEYSCSFHTELLLSPMKSYRKKATLGGTRSLVNLGEDKLCFVQTCGYFKPVKTQPIQVTYIKLMEDGKMDVMDEKCYWFKLLGEDRFLIGFCFSVPEAKAKATALKPCETFIFNPFTRDLSKQEDKTDSNLESENVTLYEDGALFNSQATSGLACKNVASKAIIISDEDGRSVIVMDLPPDATARQLMRGLKKFGHLKMVRLIRDTKENCCFAFVDFESATSMRRAVEASPITIAGCSTHVLELRGTSLSKVDNIGESSSSKKWLQPCTRKNRKRKWLQPCTISGSGSNRVLE